MLPGTSVSRSIDKGLWIPRLQSVSVHGSNHNIDERPHYYGHNLAATDSDQYLGVASGGGSKLRLVNVGHLDKLKSWSATNLCSLVPLIAFLRCVKSFVDEHLLRFNLCKQLSL